MKVFDNDTREYILKYGINSKYLEFDKDNNIKMTFAPIPDKNFEMQVTPITQDQWFKIMDNKPSYFKNKPNNPVEQVSWDDCQEFIKILNNKDLKYNYKLPNEKEWEYCCRAGTKRDYYWGNNENCAVNFSTNTSETTSEVYKNIPNPWGLFDMSGNVWEWCQDLYNKSGSYRVLRGGGWAGNAQNVRSANRNYASPGNHLNVVGFRLVRIPK